MIDRDKLIMWLENIHRESNELASKADNHMIEGMHLWKSKSGIYINSGN